MIDFLTNPWTLLCLAYLAGAGLTVGGGHEYYTRHGGMNDERWGNVMGVAVVWPLFLTALLGRKIVSECLDMFGEEPE